MFVPSDIEDYDKGMEAIANTMSVKTSSEVRLTSLEYFEAFKKAIIKIKKNENIKSNGTALMRMVELANWAIVHKPEENGEA